MPVVAWGQGQCLAANLTWRVQDTGDRSADCERTWEGATCYSSQVSVKSLKVALAQPAGPVVAETTASIRSTLRDFAPESIFALCSAAFYKFPEPLASDRFSVSLE